jgi:hypothetical protein
MKKYAFRLFIMLIGIMVLIGCTKKSVEGPKIAWVTGSYITYNYSGGVMSGFVGHIRFHVTDETSGNIKMTAVGKSCTHYVEPGQLYEVIVVCNLTSTPKTNKVIIECPTAPQPYTISSNLSVGVSSISIQ